MDCWRHEGVRGIMRPSVHTCLGRAGRRRVRHLRWGMAPVWLVLAVAIALPAPTPARAQSLNCSDFTYQEDAQANLNAFPSDPNGLDDDNDGMACEDLPHRPSGSTASPDASGGGRKNHSPDSSGSAATAPISPFKRRPRRNSMPIPPIRTAWMMTTTVSPAKTCHPDPVTSPVRRLRRS
jgi:hypothetical protein